MAMEPPVIEEWPEYPVLLSDGTWIGGCNMPHWTDEGRCGGRTLPGTDICAKHKQLADFYNKWLRPIDLAIGRIASWIR